MGLFDGFKKKQPPENDYTRLSALGDNPEAYCILATEELKQLVLLKCVEYGVTQDSSRISTLFALYRHAMEILDVNERLELLTEFCGMTEERQGEGHMGIMMFLAADNTYAVCSSAALSLSVLFDPKDQGELAGPSFVVNSVVNRNNDPLTQGASLAGVLLLGDRRLLPLLQEAWNQIEEEAQLEITNAKASLASEGLVEFWLFVLESGCSESIFGSTVAALAKMPAITKVPFVVEIQRLFPAYAGGEPMMILRQTSFSDYLNQIRPRLEALEQVESEPKLIPRIYEIWENPEKFREVFENVME